MTNVIYFVLSIFFLFIEKRYGLNISLLLHSIMDLDELTSLMKLKLTVNVSWVDLRLTFKNVHKNLLNSIGLPQKHKIWMPILVFDNANDKKVVYFDDQFSYGNIELDQNIRGKRAPLNEVQNYIEFMGVEGYLNLNIVFCK